MIEILLEMTTGRIEGGYPFVFVKDQKAYEKVD
jgi:hypothetical protein